MPDRNAPEPRGRKAPLEIHFYCDSVPFNEKTIELDMSLGGSESAMILLAKGLARRGHTVVIYTRFDLPEGTTVEQAAMKCSDGVYYFPNDNGLVSSILRARIPEVFVSLRHFPIMNWADLIDCKLRILWNEDLLSTPAPYFAASWQTDLHAFVSEYHLEQYCREIPDIRDMSWATVNPADCQRVFDAIQGVERDPKRLIHISRPERALVKGPGSPLLEIFAKMREQDPELTLGICRYHSMYESNPNVAGVCRRADELVEEAEGVEWLGELGKDDLYRAIAGSALMLYPGVPDFAETGCVAATESQLCETPFLGTHIGALPETLNAAAVDQGCLIQGDASSDEYQAAFVEKALGLLARDPDGDPCLAYRDLQKSGLHWAMTYDLDNVAREWEAKILRMFADRFKSRRKGVFDRLVMQDDLRSARMMARKWHTTKAATAELAEWEGTRNESPESYAGNAINPAAELANSPRFQVMGYTLTTLVDDPETWEGRILNYASGNGSLAAILLKALPRATVLDMDYSQELLDAAAKFIYEDFEEGAHSERFTTECWEEGEVREDLFGTFDLVIAGEIAEHFEHPEVFLADIERYAKEPTVVVEGSETVEIPGGRVFCSVPQGAFRELMHRNSLDWTAQVRGHKFHFEKRDIEAMVAHKDDFDDVHIPMGETQRGTLYGHYLFHWRRDGQEIREPDIERKIVRMRPRDTVSVCIIARNNENDILRCLKSVDTLADEIWIADTGSTDATMLLAKPYTHNGGGIETIGTCPDAPEGVPPPGDFGWARNESIKHATGDWILWIDTDEMLEHPEVMARYLTDNAFNGYAMRQCHVMKDAPYRFDKPIRMFRRVPRGKQAGEVYTCEGAIHEHFQPSLNALIEPALMVDGGDIIHTGYVNENIRREKCEHRNIPHLVYDREKYPDRILGDLLEAREYCNYARWEREDAMRKGDPDPPVIQYRDLLMRGLAILSDNFMDPTGTFWEAAFQVYQDTLKLLDVGRDFLVAEILPNGDMVGEKMRFANEDHHRIYVEDVLRRIKDHGKRPPITWAEGSDPSDNRSRTPVVGLGAKRGTATQPGERVSVAGEVRG